MELGHHRRTGYTVHEVGCVRLDALPLGPQQPTTGTQPSPARRRGSCPLLACSFAPVPLTASPPLAPVPLTSIRYRPPASSNMKSSPSSSQHPPSRSGLSRCALAPSSAATQCRMRPHSPASLPGAVSRTGTGTEGTGTGCTGAGAGARAGAADGVEAAGAGAGAGAADGVEAAGAGAGAAAADEVEAAGAAGAAAAAGGPWPACRISSGPSCARDSLQWSSNAW